MFTMENKRISKLALILTITIVIIGALFVGLIAKTIIAPETNTTASTSKSVEIKKDKYNKIVNPTNYGTPISTSGEGFGRTDPFAPYK